MIIIAECGSTKCDWVLVGKSGQVIARDTTSGYNPNFDPNEILQLSVQSLSFRGTLVDRIYFYGTGCQSFNAKKKVTQILEEYWKSEIQVQSDMKAVIDACCMPEAGICCILGTGSNACYYDGQVVHSFTPSLGYLINDDGSGYDHGLRLLRAYFFDKLSNRTQEKFRDQYGNLEKDTLIEEVYYSGKTRQYISSFMPFILENIHLEDIRDLSNLALASFVDIYLIPMRNVGIKGPVHFVGSVAYYRRDDISQLLQEEGFKVGTFNRNPIEQLVKKLPYLQ